MLNSGDRKNLRRKDALKGSAGVATVWMLMAGIPVAAVGLGATIAPAIADSYSAVSLTGQVVDADGAPVAGATVKVTSATGITRTATSDASGNVVIPNLPQGEYKIEVSAGGFQTASNDIRLTQASSSYEFTLAKTGAERVVVLGARRKFDFDRTTRGQVTDVTELQKRVPIARNVNSVAQLAPSTARGDDNFGYGNTTSISGASVGENVFYVNGLNVTNFRTLIGGGELPFEFYDTVEVKTGGYPAEFGRGTGGIVNAISKSGSNDWHYGAIVTWQPDWATQDAPDTYLALNKHDRRDLVDLTAYVSGALIEDKLFFYVLYQGVHNDTYDVNASSAANKAFTSQANNNSPLYAAKIDYNISDNHRLEFTWFDTSADAVEDIFFSNVTTGEPLEYVGQRLTTFGSIGKIAKYTGQFTDWFSLSALYGHSDRYDGNFKSANPDVTAYIDTTAGFTNFVGSPNSPATSLFDNTDERELFRIDADFLFELVGLHHVRVGYDVEDLTSDQSSRRSGPPSTIVAKASIFCGYDHDGAGTVSSPNTAACSDSPFDGQAWSGVWQRYNASQRGGCDPNLPNPDAPGSLNCLGGRWRYDVYSNNGGFSTKDVAWYVQDSWKLGDLTLLLGIRNEGFENKNLNGDTFIEMSDQWAPRLGFSWDVFGDGTGKAYGSWGTYYLPVASNTNIRLGGAETFFRVNYRAPCLNGPDGRPNPAPGCELVYESTTVLGPGVVPTLQQARSEGLESFEDEEYTLGYQHDFTNWRLGLSYTHRELQQVIEDMAIDAAVNAYCAAHGLSIGAANDPCSSYFSGFHQYVLGNPGKDITVQLLEDLWQGGVDVNDTITLSAADLKYPTATRTYDAVEFTFERVFDGIWGLQGSYTWARSKGNYEGAVKSENGQDDAALTQDFDQPGLVDGAYGFLPNHREHTFKVFGTVSPFNNFLIGANYLLQSPRKFGCQGNHPTDAFAASYGAASWYCGGVLTPRGSQFESDWRNQLDMSFVYTIPLEGPGGEFGLRADVFNVINTEACVDKNEFGEISFGGASPTYQQCTQYQAPRAVRFQFSYRY